MKILNVITTLQTGGAEKLMVDLLPRLKSKGLEVDLCVFDGEKTTLRKEIEDAGIKVYDFGRGNHVYNPLNILRLHKLMRNYDIIHTHNYSPQLFATFGNRYNQKLVTTEHGGSNRRRSKKWFKPLDRWMYRQYDKVVCIAESTEQSLLDFLGHDIVSTIVVPNGIDVKRFTEGVPSKELESIAPNSQKIINVAGFRWEKDQDTIIRSLQQLPPDFHLFLIGDGVRRKELELLTEKYGMSDRVHFMGIRNDIPRLLQAADYIVMSSHFEGLSLSSIEGMSVGKPFVASDVPGLREVTHGAGMLFPHQDSDALAHIIMQLKNDVALYRQIAQQCQLRAKEYDISSMIEGYINVYNTLIS